MTLYSVDSASGLKDESNMKGKNSIVLKYIHFLALHHSIDVIRLKVSGIRGTSHAQSCSTEARLPDSSQTL